MDVSMPIKIMNNDRTEKVLGDYKCSICNNGEVFSTKSFIKDGEFDSPYYDCGCNACLTVYRFKKSNPKNFLTTKPIDLKKSVEKIKRRMKMSSWF